MTDKNELVTLIMSEPFFSEARLYTRVTQDAPVSIYYNGQLIGKRYLRNISMGGILIKTEDLGLSAYSLVEVELSTPEDSSLTTLRIPGVVNRINATEIAIEFENLEKGIEQIIKNTWCHV